MVVWRSLGILELAKNEFVTPEELRIKIIRAMGDEASMALAASQLYNWAARSMLSLAVFPARLITDKPGTIRLNRNATFWFAAWCALGFAWHVLSFHQRWHENAAMAASLLILTVSAAPVVGMFVLTLPIFIVSGPLTVLMALSSLAFGPEMPLGCGRVRVYAEATPPGSWAVDLIPSQSYGYLNHSIYNNEFVVREIALWIGTVTRKM